MENVDLKAGNSGTQQLIRQSKAHNEWYGYEALQLGTKSESEASSGTHMCKGQITHKDQPFRTSIDSSKNDMASY